MRYRIAIAIETLYPAGAPACEHVFRLEPSTREGQSVRDVRLSIDPIPDEQRAFRDFFANSTTAVAIRRGHPRLSVRVDALAEVKARSHPGAGPSREAVRAQALGVRALGPDAPAHFLFESPRLSLVPAITAYAAESVLPDRPVLTGVRALCERLHRDFVYDPLATSVGDDAERAFALRRGVCQDFTQVMLAGLRGLGVPAAYVSGVLRTHPPPGEPRLEGADGMHAWVRVWAGEEIGWVDFDPTNAGPAGEGHVVIAIGRDYGDIAPIDGVILTAGGHESAVSVDVAPLEETS
jgi:transglutaminase-like putative cysteine protease